MLFRQTQRVVVLGGQSSAATHKLGGTAGVNASGRGLPVSTIGIYLGLVPNEPSPGKSLSLLYLAKTHKKEAVPGEKPEDRFPPFLDKDAHKRAVLPGRVAGPVRTQREISRLTAASRCQCGQSGSLCIPNSGSRARHDSEPPNF